MAKTEKEKEVTREERRLQGLFAEIPENKKATVAGLIENAAFMRCELRHLRQVILEEGPTVSAMTGNGYEKTTENPAIKNYNSMLGKYNYTIKLLLSLLPDEALHDEFLDFVNSR